MFELAVGGQADEGGLGTRRVVIDKREYDTMLLLTLLVTLYVTVTVH